MELAAGYCSPPLAWQRNTELRPPTSGCAPQSRAQVQAVGAASKAAAQTLQINRRHTATQSQQRQVQTAATLQADQTPVTSLVDKFREARANWLEEQALAALSTAVDTFKRPVFPCALIAGDVVILHLLSRLGVLSDGRVTVIFIDTYHLFPETYTLMQQLEERYNFKAKVYHAKDLPDKKAYQAEHGSDLFIRDIDEYDRICKVEPFNRSLQDTDADVMINGRRRDHGAERANLEEFEDGHPVKSNPIAWWTFKDCFDYLDRHNLERHPLHSQGYPSVGDVHSTLPVPQDKWFEYGGERSGRFQGLKNADGSDKTECGIHVGGHDAASGLSNIRA